MTALDAIAERRIREAQERGEFDGLPGAGAPLDLDDDPLVPEDLRVAYRLLRNAGFLPTELEVHRELRDIEQLLSRVEGGRVPDSLVARFSLLVARAGARNGGRCVQVEAAYFNTVAEKLARARSAR